MAKTPPAADAALPTVPNDPTRGSHTTNRPRRNSEVQRYTVDLDREQRRTLALCAAEWEVDKSRVIRTLLYLLEADASLRERVQQELEEDNVD